MNHEYVMVWLKINHMANHTVGKKTLSAGDKCKDPSNMQESVTQLSLWPCFVKIEMASKCSNHVKGYGTV